MHVHWFQHGRNTVLGDLSNPQELFLTGLCGEVDLTCVVGKANVQYLPPGERPKKLDFKKFFYS